MVGDVMRFLDNVLSDFINKALNNLKMQNILLKEKECRFGSNGFSFFLQNIEFLESVMAKSWNKKIFKQIDEQVNKASKDLAEERGLS